MRNSISIASSATLERQALPAAPLRELVDEIAQAARFARQHIIAAIYHAGSGYPGTALSSADIMASLFGAELNFWPDSINDPDRDRFVLSKGHGAPALYAVASHYGFCNSREALRLRRFGSPFQGHPHAGDVSWVETSTGSPGQGFSVALGTAMGLRLKKRPARVYTLLGDRELQEGEVWEAAMCAARHRLDNLCVIVDYNKLQSDDCNTANAALEPLAAKWRAFDWAVAEIDGHDIPSILSTFRRAAATNARPSVIIAHTIEGKGVPFMEEDALQWRGGAKLTREQAEEALRCLGASRQDIKEWLDGSDL